MRISSGGQVELIHLPECHCNHLLNETLFEHVYLHHADIRVHSVEARSIRSRCLHSRIVGGKAGHGRTC